MVTSLKDTPKRSILNHTPDWSILRSVTMPTERVANETKAAPAAAATSAGAGDVPLGPVGGGARTGTLHLDGASLYYAERGEGPPVLLIHPAGSHADTWG